MIMDLNVRDITAFFATTGALVAAAEKIDAELALRLGRGFNVFDAIRPDENRLSDILRDLLDPRGPHGQGDRFLRAFLDICKIGEPWSKDTNNVRVYRERQTISLDEDRKRRRIDLVIAFGASAGAVAIENKPWAGEQNDQMKDYAEHLNHIYQDRFHLLYLSGNGRPPETLGEWDQCLKEVVRFHPMAYNRPASQDREMPNLHDWTAQCARLTEADKLRWFLRDFAAWIAENFETPALDEGGEDALPHA